ncbi:uncharacterized protein NEMAJ01_1019 [Nematocida major]|uniref:uncharacterized protein n=1 Tax=Nematocida major TaxID=1912982 RepID=UPI0020075541|nr:uncharacterized protein NEMAJ01_1019 [Nematocida major]KAH9386123.1 hypothetical protein NEMAJ01_1019 [Nematocida major]
MEDNQHIRLDLDELKHSLLQELENVKTGYSIDRVLAALSSRVKTSLKDIPEEKRTKINELVYTFLENSLKKTFGIIAKTHGVLTPGVVEILTKESTAESPCPLTQELSILHKEIESFILEQELECEGYVYRVISKKREMLSHLQRLHSTIISYCTEVLQNKTIKKFDNSGLELALSKEAAKVEEAKQALESLSAEKEENGLSLYNVMMKKEEMRRVYLVLYWDIYALKRVDDKFKMYAYNSTHISNVYFYMKKIAEEKKGKHISPEEVDFLDSGWAHSDKMCSIEEAREKIKSAEKECFSEGKRMFERAEKMWNGADKVIKNVREYLESIFAQGPVYELMKIVEIAEEKVKNLQEPEKTEMKKFRDELEEFISQAKLLQGSPIEVLGEVSKSLSADSLLETLSSPSIRKKLAHFNKSFEKIQVKFPNSDAYFSYRKAVQNLTGFLNRSRRGYKEHLMKAEKSLALLQEVGRGETTDARYIRVSEYEKFAEENPAPDFSGSIEDISSETLESGVTPREIEAMLSSLRAVQKACIKELGDKGRTEIEKIGLKKSLSEIKEEIQVLEQKLLPLANLSEEQAKKGECIRYAYLTKYKSETLKQMAVLEESLETEIVPLASEIVKKIEKIPNNPEFNKKVKEMLEKTAEKEPNSVLNTKSILESEHLWAKLPRVIVQLDKKIAETLGGSSSERTRRKLHYSLTLQNSIFALFFVFMLLSLGLVCSSEFA